MNRKAIILALTAVAIAGAFAWRGQQRTQSPSEPATSAVPTGESTKESKAPIDSENSPASPTASAAAQLAPKASPRFLDLGSDSCASCKAMVPVLAELRSTYSDQLQVDFLDVWEFPEEAKPYAIQLIPTQIFFDANGTELFRHVGFYGMEDIRAKWLELGHPLTANASQAP